MSEYFSLSSGLMKAHSPPSFEQQSFLGASITNFTLNCGMGDSSSTLNVELVVDEFNSGDGTGLGYGQDIYHNGVRDRFSPPPVGSPVFFSFGHKKANTKNSFLKTFDDFYKTSSITNTTNGYYHLSFGGILQSYNKTNSATGGEQHTVSIVDPREILSNAQLILNNYAGSTYGSVNLINLYGFLEHNLASETGLPSIKDPLTKTLRSDGSFYYTGSDMRYTSSVPTVNSAITYLNSQLNMYGEKKFPIDYNKTIYDPRLFQSAVNIGLNPSSSGFPLTGTGFARIQDGGMPIYRAIQAINGLSGFNGPIPSEYTNAGYNGYIYFRGLKYVVDLTSLPIVDPMQRLDFDQISILDFCLELCDIANHDLMVSLLPIIDVCVPFYNFNRSSSVSASNPPFGGIIKVWSIDRSKPPRFGALQKFIDSIKNPVSTDVGFELSNITSDKFLIGAQTVNQYFFCSEEDRPLPANEYKLEKMFDMQVIPYYGLIDNQAVTIPKGTGPYKQILLDSSTLNANGVGDFYVATEMELRCASVSYEQWSKFLLSYNDKYLESVEADDIRDNITISQSTQAGGNQWIAKEENYAVTVPRCVWGPKDSDVAFSGNLPVAKNFCNPPYGYPLYFKRATQIGIPEAGLVGTVNKSSRVVTDIEKLMSMKPDEQGVIINNIYKSLIESREYGKDFSPIEQELFDIIKTYKDALEATPPQPLPNTHALSLDGLLKNAIAITARSKKQSKSSLRNAKRVYDFVKNIADECLGKKYLVKIPQRVNTSFDYFIHGSGGAVNRRGVNYSPQSILTNNIFHNNTSIESGPYGFMPRAINSTTESTTKSASFIKDMLQEPPSTFPTDKTKNWKGALKFNKNPFTDEFEFNYVPEPNGGFYDFNMEKNVNGGSLAVRQGLVPIDLGKFINENGRLGAYVRFDNSHFLSFDKMSSDSFVQQKKENGFFSPDVSYNLPNTVGIDYIPSKEDIATNNNNPSVAFVKCTLDDKFYMPPSGSFVLKKVYNSVLKKTIKQKPHKVRDPRAACKEVDSITPLKLSFEPTSTPTNNTYQVYDFEFRTNRKDFNDPAGTTPLTSDQMGLYKPYLDLDTRHVYALITLPDRVVPTVTTLMGGLPSTPNILTYMHLLFVDTIKASQDPGGFAVLQGTTANSFPPDFTSKKYRDEFSLEEIEKNATEAEKKAISGLTFASQEIDFAAPSPVIPSLVALPMLSKEDCYGPWRGIMFHDLNNDNNLDYNVDMLTGGKIEFIKDENLAPWNFNGYALMDEHGKSLARFLSTPMICSERGGFTVTDAPSGISLGSIINYSEPDPQNPTSNITFYGPLITNISISISSDNIQTTYQCNSYTPSFGRLEKKRQELIAKIVRNQQKLKDEKNALIRKNIGKNQNGLDYNKIYKDMMNISKSTSQTAYSPIEAGKPVGNNALEIVSIQPQMQDTTIVRSNGTRQDVPNSLRSSSSAMSTSYENYAETASTMSDNPISLFRSHYFSAIEDKSSMSVAISMDPSHPAMPSVENESMINMEYGDSVEGATYWS
jgi:hypothetical protein